MKLSLPICAALTLLTACKENPQPVPVAPLQAAPRDDIASALGKVLTEKPESLSDADNAGAVDASKLLGRWAIKHTIMRTNGETNGPTPPIVPTEWTFGADGSLTVTGGMRIDARYVYTGGTLLIAGVGPKQTYSVDALSDTELTLTAQIVAGVREAAGHIACLAPSSSSSLVFATPRTGAASEGARGGSAPRVPASPGSVAASRTSASSTTRSSPTTSTSSPRARTSAAVSTVSPSASRAP